MEEKKNKNTVTHTIDPVFDLNSKILILGTMPSVKSREYGFFYMHPQNTFWKILSDVLDSQFPSGIEDKKRFLLKNKIAVWDVLKSCEIKGSSDSSIKNPLPNDIPGLMEKTDIRAIFTTGKAATALFKKHCSRAVGMESIYLPSTSPANNTISYQEKLKEWEKILLYL